MNHKTIRNINQFKMRVTANSITYSECRHGIGKVILVISFFSLILVSCKKFIEVGAPVTSTNASNVFNTDATASAVLTGIYALISNDQGGGMTGIGLFTALSSDELTLFDLNNLDYQPYYRNSLLNTTGSGFGWQTIYPILFQLNAALEGLAKSNTLSPVVKDQLIGEAKFMRALCYFYLVNIYGDVPLVNSTDYKVNATLPRAAESLVDQLIINDLIEAQILLNPNYLNGDALTAYTQGAEERVRPTRWAATALLARIYLYTKDFKNAEIEATKVINESSLYDLVDLNNVFLKNSQEAIWQLQPVNTNQRANTVEGFGYILPATGPAPGSFGSNGYPVYLSENFIQSIEPGDQRLGNWIDSVKPEAVAYYFPKKYKVGAELAPVSEYIMVLRLGEQFLIRAEARAQQNNVAGAREDLNAIRTRAGLGSTPANDQASLLEAIYHERRIELFTEWGHRWFDLKRTGNIDNVMTAATALKGGVWKSYQQYYPIPQDEILKNVNLSQNAGY